MSCVFALPSEIQISRRDLERDFLVGDIAHASRRRTSAKKEVSGRSAQRLVADLHAQRDTHFPNAQQVSVKAVGHGLIRTPWAVAQLCFRQFDERSVDGTEVGHLGARNLS